MGYKEEPPDKYRCLKVPFHSLFRKENIENDTIFSTIQDAVTRANQITTKTYFVLRLWLLNKYHTNQPIPVITDNTISMCMNSLLKPSSGNKPKGDNLQLLQEFKKFHSFDLEDGANLSAILDYYKVTMITAIENNIKMRFFDYVKRFVNAYFEHLYQDQTKNKEFKKQLKKELYQVKNDIINHTVTCGEKYHTWLRQVRYRIVPETFDKSYYYDIQVRPYSYIKGMIYMCLELEKLERKSFQFFPLQTNAIPRHIQIDTKALIELLVDTKQHATLIDKCVQQPRKNKQDKEMKKSKQDLYSCIEINREFIWDTFFDIHPKMKKYEFDYTIITDGYACSLRFLHGNCVEQERQKKAKMKQGKKDLQGLTEEEKQTKKQDKKPVVKSIPIKKPKKEEEFPYIDEIPKEQLQGKHIFIDPGKRSLLTMMDDTGNFMFYRNKQRIKETKRFKYQRRMETIKRDTDIGKIEQGLAEHNSKTCHIDKFREYITEKIQANKMLIPLYQDVNFRKYKWYAYINKKRSEDRLLNKIENKYSKDHIIIIGDWSIGKQMRHFMSTPNLSIKRKLKERFQVYNLDEYRTSCLNYITEEICENMYLPDKKKKERKIHSILTYKMENNRMGCINRDRNGCKNIQKVFVSYMDTNERPERYKREQQKLPTAEKVVKTTKKPSNGKPASRRSFTPCPTEE